MYYWLYCILCRVVAERLISQALIFLISSVVRVPVLTRVSLSKTLNYYCFVLRMGRKAVGLVWCVMPVKELPRFFWQWLLNALQHLVNPYKLYNCSQKEKNPIISKCFCLFKRLEYLIMCALSDYYFSKIMLMCWVGFNIKYHPEDLLTLLCFRDWQEKPEQRVAI